jgi:general stress protein 26
MDPTVEMPDMSSYGVDPATWSGLPWAWATERLVPNRNYWVSTVSAAGQPHSLPVWGVWDAERNLFMFSCAPDARKLRNIVANPKVCVANPDAVECVSVQGSARLLQPGAAGREEWVAAYAAKYGSEVPGDLAGFVRSHTIVEVCPAVAFAVIETEEEFATRATRWRFPG